MKPPTGYELEVLAAEELDVESYAIHLDGIVNGDAERSLTSLPRPAGRTWIYRGWMLDEAEYTLLYDAIIDRGEQLHVDPESFVLTSLMPNYLHILGDRTPQSVWTESESVKEAWWLGDEVDSPFFVADVARLAAGGFTVIELNDGGSAILPERLDPRELYRAIAE